MLPDFEGNRDNTQAYEVQDPVQVETRLNKVPAPAEAKPITSIAQLPSIWRLEANVEWLIDGIIPLGSVNLVTAESGTGKTWLAYAIAGAVARGEAFAGMPVKQRPVLYLDGENPLCVVKQRLWDLGILETPPLRIWGGWVDPPPPGPNNTLLREYAREHHPLLIWDPLVQFHDGEEQSATETRKFMDQFRRLAHAGATVIIVHHTGKTGTSKEYRGSSDIKAAVDMAYVLETTSTLKGRVHRLVLRNFKGRYAPGRNIGVEFVHRQGFVPSDVPAPIKPVDAMEIVFNIVGTNPHSNQSQIIAFAVNHGISKHQVEKCLKDDRFNRQRGNRKEWLYSLAEVQTPSLPAPSERDIGILPAPAEVVA